MKNVMFVDDESRILDGIRRMMYAERKRWNMEFALGGEAALQALEAKPFDIVVTDMRMPGMDGATLLTRVREISPITVRIILSGHTELEAAMRAIPVAHRFLAKPCNASALREAIERTCKLQDLLNNEEIRRVVSGIAELPSSQVSFNALTETLNDPAVTLERLTAVIEKDMAMTAKVLQFANSGFFGATQVMTTVAGGVGYLGVDTIKNLALNVKAFRVLEPHPAVLPGFWEELSSRANRTVGIINKLPLEKEALEVAVVAGFLHDIGDLIAAGYIPEIFAGMLASAKEGGSKAYESEEKKLGFSHAEIGAYLLGIWGLPQPIVDAIAHHHHPTRVPHMGLDPITAVYVADLLADGGTPAQADQDTLNELGLAQQFAEWQKSLPQQALAAKA
ncbi:MAG TPA: response regulator [Terriglobales bacterium]|jgi:putative nucleotidyltransferase with HDIG domain|nr:response regulator [Terriglobales bacterium]